MNDTRNRQKWLRILLGLFSAWTSFLVSIAFFLIIVWIVQTKILDIEISGAPAMIILIIELAISIFSSYKFTRWQNRYLDNKSLTVNYIILTILILLSILFAPTSFYYMIN